MIQVLVDGFKPLIMETMIDFPDGSEALVTLTYKKLRRHFHYCFRLSHEEKDCLKKPISKEPYRHPTALVKPKEPAANSNYTNQSSQRNVNEIQKHYHTPSGRPNESLNSSYSAKRTYSAREEVERSQTEWKSREYKTTSIREGYSNGERTSGVGSRDLRDRLQNYTSSVRSSQNQHLQWREKTHSRDNFRQDSSKTSTTRSLKKGL